MHITILGQRHSGRHGEWTVKARLSSVDVTVFSWKLCNGHFTGLTKRRLEVIVVTLAHECVLNFHHASEKQNKMTCRLL
jgi:hypothetical protein